MHVQRTMNGTIAGLYGTGNKIIGALPNGRSNAPSAKVQLSSCHSAGRSRAGRTSVSQPT